MTPWRQRKVASSSDAVVRPVSVGANAPSSMSTSASRTYACDRIRNWARFCPICRQDRAQKRCDLRARRPEGLHPVGVLLHLGILREQLGVLLARLLPLRREVLGGPQPLMRAIILE